MGGAGLAKVLDACSRVPSGLWCVADARGQWGLRAHLNCGSRVTQPRRGRGMCLGPPRTRAPQMGPVESSQGWDCGGLGQGRIATERVQQGLSVGGRAWAGRPGCVKGDAVRPRGAASGGGPGLGRCEWSSWVVPSGERSIRMSSITNLDDTAHTEDTYD